MPAGRGEGDVRSRNLMLMMAYTVHKRGLCPKCGYPREVCRRESTFSAQREVCYASAVVEAQQEEEQKRKDPAHGVMWLPVKHDTKSVDEEMLSLPPGMFD